MCELSQTYDKVEVTPTNLVSVNIFSDVIIIALPITMVTRLQMKLKQKLAVSGIFALGFFVIISSSELILTQHMNLLANDRQPVVRAYYSHRNETMLTCTVSMVETAIAIVTACLPALRSMAFPASTNDPSSYGKHYELGSSHRRTGENRTVGSGGITSGPRSNVRKSRNPNGSEDSLVTSGLSVGLDGRGKIRVETTIEAQYETDDAKSRAESSRSPV